MVLESHGINSMLATYLIHIYTHLLFVVFRVGQHGGHVEHELVALIHCVDGFNSCCVICR